MHNQLIKSVRYGEVLDMMYMAKGGSISKRRIKVLQVGETSFRAYCLMRNSNRIFIIDSILALVPVYEKEKVVI